MPPTARRWTSSQKRSVGARQSWCCARCGKLLPATFEVDHVRALHLGGADDIETNAEALCNHCHSSKTLQERLALDAAMRKARAKAEAEEGAADGAGGGPVRRATTSARKRPLAGKRPLLAPTVGSEVLQNRFLRFGYVKPL